MAGGEGAKERRRLKRLAETGGASAATEKKTPDAEASGPPAKRDNKGPPNRDSNGPPARDSRGPPNRYNTGYSKDGWKDKKLDNKPKRYSDSPKGNWKDKKFEKKPFNKKGGTPTRKASNKSKKPKHLKRKLEQVADDEEAEQKVLRDLKEFETKKEELSQRNKRPKDNSYEKKTQDVSMSQALTGQKKPTLVAEETYARPVEEEPFVRSTTATKTEEAEEESVSEEGSATPVAVENSDDEAKDEGAEEEDSATPAAMDESDDEFRDEEAVEEKDSDDDEAEGESAAEIKEEDKNGAKDDSSSDDDSSDSNDSDSEDEGEEGRRQRGKRRKGRKDTAALIQETEKEVEAKKAAKKSAEKEDGEKKGDPNKKTLRRDDKRRCIGRNPVTSFKLGEKYPAKVVYIKPFGVFFDIGCHSDAFCHVSRLQDDYIKNPTDMFKEGDEVSARVVEVDRRAKRITVSLQSDARAEDERASIEARQKRKDIIKNKDGKKNRVSPGEELAGDSREAARASPAAVKIVIKAPPSINKAPASRPKAPSRTRPPQQKDESQMNPAELKRARKLARRASRREEQGQEAPQ